SKKSCDSVAQDPKCDDGKFCNGGEACEPTNPAHDSKGCVAGTAPVCDDKLAWTTNACADNIGGCKLTPLDSLCAHADNCTGTETCDTTLGCVAGPPLTCS